MRLNLFSSLKLMLSHRRLRLDITTSFLVLFLTSSIFILFYTYQGTKTASIYFAQQILNEISDTTLAKTSNYIGDAKTSTIFAERFVDSAHPDFLNDEKLRKNYMRVLSLYPYFNVVQIALANGDYLSVERAHPGTKYITMPDKPLQDNVVYLSQHQIRSKEGQPQEVWTYFDAEFRVVSQEINEFLVYDGRKRPWYLNTEQKREFNWSPIYTFSFSNLPGTTASVPLFNKLDDKENMIGVVGVDLSLEEMSQFLQTNKVSANGTSFILNESEQLVASSNPKHLIAKDPKSETIITIDGINDEHLKMAYKTYKETQENIFQFSYQDTVYLASFSKLNNESRSFWLVAIVVPIDDFLAQAKSIRQNIFLVILIALIISIFMILLLSKRISQPIIAVANETQKIQQLDINGDFFLKSGILEIQLMLSSISAMRKSLLSFGKFVPKTLVKKLIQSGGDIKLGGKKKELTIFFSDIENFTNISEAMPAEKLVTHLSSYLDELSNIISESNGTIDKYIGDAIMAFWGAPINDRNQTFNACHAALTCQKRLSELNRQWELDGLPVFRTRIGLHFDEALVGIIGSKEKMNYTIMGDGVNAASRLEGLNKEYGTLILVSEKAAERVFDDFLFRPLDLIAVKGKKKPLKVYELMAQNKNDAALLPSEQQRELAMLFTKAFHLYTLQKWDEALKHFKEILTLFPSDPPTKLLIQRCESFQKTPPPIDWDGVTAFTHK